MKRVASLLSLVGLLLLACAPASSSQSPTPTSSSSSQEEPAPSNVAPPADAIALSPAVCPAASAHVYHPARLHLLAGCKEVSAIGVIRSSKAEPDGDFHIRLRVDPSSLDPKGGHWINAENTRQQRGDLVLEPVCEKQVTQSDAVSACASYHNPLQIPPIGSHVSATGFWVFDASHGWTEIHPVTKMERVP